MCATTSPAAVPGRWICAGNWRSGSGPRTMPATRGRPRTTVLSQPAQGWKEPALPGTDGASDRPAAGSDAPGSATWPGAAVRGATEPAATTGTDVGSAGAANSDFHATWLPSPCLGLCEAAPAVLLQLAGESDHTLTVATADRVCAALAAAARGGGKRHRATGVRLRGDGQALGAAGELSPRRRHGSPCCGGWGRPTRRASATIAATAVVPPCAVPWRSAPTACCASCATPSCRDAAAPRSLLP